MIYTVHIKKENNYTGEIISYLHGKYWTSSNKCFKAIEKWLDAKFENLSHIENADGEKVKKIDVARLKLWWCKDYYVIDTDDNIICHFSVQGSKKAE